MVEMLKMYRQLNDEQKERIFTKEQKDCLDRLDFFGRLFTDNSFYNAVCTALGEQIYKEFNE